METRLFFNRFPVDTSEQDIHDLFSQYGKVTGITLFKSKETGEPFGRGYVTLDSSGSAQAAIEALNDRDIEGLPVRVKLDERIQEKEKAKQVKKPPVPFQAEANEVARLLGETEFPPRQTIRRIIAIKGLDFVQEALAETFRIEEQGGMMLPDGSRRRTTGGVFFALVRQNLDREDFFRIYPHKGRGKPSESAPHGEA